MKRLLNRLHVDIWQFAAALIVVLSFSVNLLSTVSVYNFSAYQSDSEQLVHNAFYCQDKLGSGAHSGLLIIRAGEDCKKDTVPYFSQSGAPYWLMGLMYPASHQMQRAYLQTIKVLLAITSAVMLVSMCRKMMDRLERRYQLLVAALLALSPWLVEFSVNLFWLLPLLLAPLWFSWVWYEKLRLRPWVFYGVLGLIFMTKFLAGYEYASTLAIGAVSPVVYYELRKRKYWKDIVTKCLFVLAAACAGFLLAFSVNLAQASHEMGSVGKGYRIIYERAKLRTFAAADPNIGAGIMNQLKLLKPLDYEYLEWNLHLTKHISSSRTDRLWQNAVVLYQYIAAPAITLPVTLAFPYNVLFGSVGTFTVIICVLIVVRYKKYKKRFAYKEPLLLSTDIALMGGFSWLIFGHQHSFIHTHINTIIFYLPFLPQAYVVIAQDLQVRFKQRNRYAKSR